MTSREYKKRITRTLKYSETFDNKGKYIGGGIQNSTPHIESEMWVEIMDDQVMDRETGEWVTTGRPQIHLAGTQRAFEELGVLLLALANYAPPQSGYSISIELNNRENQPGVHFVVHLPVESLKSKPAFSKVHNVASGIIEKGGNIIDTTLPGKKDAS